MQQHAVCLSPYCSWTPSKLLLRLRSVLPLLKLLLQGRQDAFSVRISKQHRTLRRIRVDSSTAIEDVSSQIETVVRLVIFTATHTRAHTVGTQTGNEWGVEGWQSQQNDQNTNTLRVMWASGGDSANTQAKKLARRGRTCEVLCEYIDYVNIFCLAHSNRSVHIGLNLVVLTRIPSVD